MTQKLEETKRGGGGSIRVGSTGTISSLMNKELDSSDSLSHTSSSSKRNPQSVQFSMSSNDRTLKLRKSMDEAQIFHINPRSPEKNRRRSGGQIQHFIPVPGPKTQPKQKSSPEEASCSRDGNVKRSLDLPWKTRIHKRTHRIPMLGSENAALDKTPKRETPARKVSMVEVVDTNCGVPAGSLSNRLKKLSFSKLSQSIT